MLPPSPDVQEHNFCDHRRRSQPSDQRSLSNFPRSDVLRARRRVQLYRRLERLSLTVSTTDSCDVNNGAEKTKAQQVNKDICSVHNLPSRNVVSAREDEGA